MSLTTNPVRFASFEMDPTSRELRRQGIKVRLGEQPFRVLCILVGHAGQVVGREELRQQLWPADTFVDFEHSVNAAVKRLREVLDDSAETPRFIETLPRHGYRFICPIEAPKTEKSQAFPALRWRLWAGALILGSMVALGVIYLRTWRHGSPPVTSKTVRSLAVLPMENLSNDPKQEYFAAGMTEALIRELGRIPALRVISRQSVMQYKGSAKTVPQIARELNVDAIVEGATVREGDKVRISTQLIRAEPEEHLWAASYERDLRGVIALQRQVASDITAQINFALTSEQPAQPPPARPVDPKALEAYLHGSYALSRIGLPNAAAAVYFQQAVSLDPNYAQAYVGLCLANVQMGLGVGPLPPKQAFAEAKSAALQAIKLDATLGDAQTCLAWVKAFGEWDWSGGESAFRKAIELSPNSVQAHRLYSWYLSAMERHKQAIAEGQRARDLDPLSLAAGYTMGSSYWWARQYQSCAAEAVNLERIDPTFPGAQALRGLVYLQTGSYDEAVSRFERALSLSHGDMPVWSLARLGCAYSRSGRRDEALHILDQLLGATDQYISPYAVAFLYTSLDNRNKAFEWLEKAYAERNPMLAFLRVEPMLDPLRSDPRFRALLRRVHFPR